LNQLNHLKARVGALSRSRNSEDPDLVTARASLKAARVEDYITRVVNEAPPLTAEQRERLAVLLNAGGGALV
jgi:hypothetical protein